MSIFGFNEAAAIAAWGAANTLMTDGDMHHHRDMVTKAKIKIDGLDMHARIRPWGAMMRIILLTITIFYFTQNTAKDSWQLITGVVLFLVHLFAVRAWTRLLWRSYWPRAALSAGVLAVATGIGLLLSMIINQTDTNHLWWVPVLTLSLYFIWVIYYFIVNLRFVHHARKHRHHPHHATNDNEAPSDRSSAILYATGGRDMKEPLLANVIQHRIK